MLFEARNFRYAERRTTVEQVLYIFAKTVSLFLSAISACMFMRVILQLFVRTEDNKLLYFFTAVSELFVFPFRVIMAKFNIMQGTPIDAPFFVAYLFIALMNLFLPMI